MKPAIQALALAPQFHDAAVRGDKRVTIREGHRDYEAGRPLVLFCDKVGWAFVTGGITGVRHTTLAEVTAGEYEADGFTSYDNLRDGMREFYPSIDFDSPVTVISWGDIK